MADFQVLLVAPGSVRSNIGANNVDSLSGLALKVKQRLPSSSGALLHPPQINLKCTAVQAVYKLCIGQGCGIADNQGHSYEFVCTPSGVADHEAAHGQVRRRGRADSFLTLWLRVAGITRSDTWRGYFVSWPCCLR